MPRYQYIQQARRFGRTATSTLIKELDGLFSEWLRRGNSVAGQCHCFICGTRKRWQEMQAMHYVDRDQMALRYDVSNVYVGCESCNCFDDDHHERFKEAILKKRGQEVLDFLEVEKRSLQKWMPHELQERIDFLKAEIKKMKT
jgi:uncharacterized small protein (DUF1192 family)